MSRNRNRPPESPPAPPPSKAKGEGQPSAKNDCGGKSVAEIYQSVVDRSHTQLERVDKAYKWLLTSIGLLVAVGLYFSYNSAKDFRKEMKDDGVELQKRLVADSERLSKKVQDELDSSVRARGVEMQEKLQARADAIARAVETKIDSELKPERVAQLITTKVDERVTFVADDRIKVEIGKRLEPKIAELENKVKSLNEEIRLANLVRDNLQQQAELMMTVIGAQTDDRGAFDRLAKWSEDPSYTFRVDAKRAYRAIVEADDNVPSLLFLTDWFKGDLGKLTPEQVRLQLDNEIVGRRVGILQHIWTRPDFDLADKLEVAINTIKTERSMFVIHHACTLINGIAKIDRKPLIYQYYLDWWNDNRNQYMGQKAERLRQKKP